MFKRHKKNQSIRATTHQDDESHLFRRSQTITGSRASSVRAANEQSGQLQSDRLRSQRLRRIRTIIITALLSLIIFFAVVIYMLSQYTFSVSTINSTQPNVLIPNDNKKVYQKTILEYVQSRPSERFQFAVNSKELTKYVSTKYPEVADIRPQPRSGSYDVTFRKPIAVWKLGTQQLFVDREGESFEKSYFPETPTLSIVDKSGVAATKGQAIISKNYLFFIGKVIGLVQEKKGGTVSEITIPPNATRQVEIRLTDKPFTIKMLSSRVPEHTVEDLQKVLSHLQSKNITPEYIDLRLTGRAYYK